MAFYKKVIVERDTPQLKAERIRLREIHEQAARERDALWPILTIENCVEAARWHEKRLSELLKKF